jgi:hypothetical protein
MEKNIENFKNLYDFIDLATSNKKYPENTANNLKSALKIFEKELNAYEKESINMIENSIGEIFRSVVMANKNKSIVSLNTYKARLLKVINDYKKYGQKPDKIQGWQAKTRKSTPLLIKKDKTDKKNIDLSNPIFSAVENYKNAHLFFEEEKITIIIPKNIAAKDAEIIKKFINSLVT